MLKRSHLAALGVVGLVVVAAVGFGASQFISPDPPVKYSDQWWTIRGKGA